MTFDFSEEGRSAFNQNGAEAKRLQLRLEALRAARPELFPGIIRFDVEGCCKIKVEEERTAVAVWAVVPRKSWRGTEGLESQNAAFTLVNNCAPEDSVTWREGARALAPNIDDRQGYAMVFARSTDLEATIAQLENTPNIELAGASVSRGLPSINNAKPNWVSIMESVGNVAAGVASRRT